MARPYTDEQLVELCRARNLVGPRDELPLDCPHLDRLLRRHEERISRWCVQVLHHRDDAADAAQEVLLRIYKGIRNFRAHCTFTTWIYSITRSVCLDTLERRKAQSSRERSLDADGTESAALEEALQPGPAGKLATVNTVAAQEARLLFRAMFERHITPQESRVMILHHVDGLSMKAITRALGLANASGARAFLASAKRKLRNHLPTNRLAELGYRVPSPTAVFGVRGEIAGSAGQVAPPEGDAAADRTLRVPRP